MKFEALIAIVPEDMEEDAIQTAKDSGAGGVTIIKGRNIGLKEKKVFFGLTFEENISVLLFVLPRKLTMSIFKAMRKKLDLENKDDAKGMVMTLPITHLTGIDMSEIELFEDEILDFL